jgi:superoxide dismutase
LEKDKEIKQLRNEVSDLKETVSGLAHLVNKLTSTMKTEIPESKSQVVRRGYQIFGESESALNHDVSWTRLVNLLQDSNSGLTAKQLSERWGKSRTRTSEVLNILVDDGHLVKYRDGREIKFRSVDE